MEWWPLTPADLKGFGVGGDHGIHKKTIVLAKM